MSCRRSAYPVSTAPLAWTRPLPRPALEQAENIGGRHGPQDRGCGADAAGVRPRRISRTAAPLTGTAGDVWTDRRGERVSVIYEPVQVLAYGLPAEDFVPDAPLDAAPF